MKDLQTPLELNEVGPYGQLSARPNPNGYAIIPVPPFERMLPFIAQGLGRDLTESEIEIERSKAPSIVVTQETAILMAAARNSRPSGAA
jgi:hypothetical protein